MSLKLTVKNLKDEEEFAEAGLEEHPKEEEILNSKILENLSKIKIMN